MNTTLQLTPHTLAAVIDVYIWNFLCLIVVVVVPIHRPHTPTPAPLRTPTMASVTHPARTPTVRKIALI